jgi:hypothetical protein
MNPNEFGKKLGIGVRVAGRIAQQRMQEKAAESARNQPPNRQQAASGTSAHSIPSSMPISIPTREEVLNQSREFAAKSHKYTRAAGRGAGRGLAAFLRPFRRVGGILWLEVTGFFFGLFGLYFAQDLWRTRLSYAAGPQHQRFLIAVALTAVFGYLSVSAFWRARRR